MLMERKQPIPYLCRWVGASVSIIGRGHRANRKPCQDASKDSLHHQVLAIVMADGAGSARHSEYGAAAAVEATTQVLGKTAPWDDRLAVQRDILSACKNKMCEQARALGCSVTDLASTLAFVAVTGDVYVAGNLGDGIVTAFYDGKPEILIGPVRGEFANETTFLTSDHADRYLRVKSKKLIDSCDGFAVMSDGAADSLYKRHEGRFAPALTRIIAWFDEHPSSTVKAAIHDSVMPKLACQTWDDCSLAVLRRVCIVDRDSFDKKSKAFRREFVGSGNEIGVRNRLAVLQSYREDADIGSVVEATGLSAGTIRSHLRTLEKYSVITRNYTVVDNA